MCIFKQILSLLFIITVNFYNENCLFIDKNILIMRKLRKTLDYYLENMKISPK